VPGNGHLVGALLLSSQYPKYQGVRAAPEANWAGK